MHRPGLKARIRRHAVLVAMLALTFSTGIVDAVGFLVLDRVFAGNMTGNVVVLGMAIARADDLPVLGPLLALAGFFAGAVWGGAAMRGVPARWTGRTTAALVGVGAVFAVLAIVLETAPAGQTTMVSSSTVLATAMGVQAAAARHLAVRDVTTVVVTSTLVGLAAELRFLGRTKGVARRVLAVGLLIAGGVAGALSLRWSPSLGLACAGVIVLVVAVLGAITAPRADGRA
ncbi:YoaK family protein [Nonomuraea lactucae]|uniref:YoaK family protein n=1 Tax=Nonomuraea lactucae TaxID=2249762 RepID=UPI000DE47ECA|nr:YoaK family protein [Nonomuraea lactucae]